MVPTGTPSSEPGLLWAASDQCCRSCLGRRSRGLWRRGVNMGRQVGGQAWQVQGGSWALEGELTSGFQPARWAGSQPMLCGRWESHPSSEPQFLPLSSGDQNGARQRGSDVLLSSPDRSCSYRCQIPHQVDSSGSCPLWPVHHQIRRVVLWDPADGAHNKGTGALPW